MAVNTRAFYFSASKGERTRSYYNRKDRREGQMGIQGMLRIFGLWGDAAEEKRLDNLRPVESGKPRQVVKGQASESLRRGDDKVFRRRIRRHDYTGRVAFAAQPLDVLEALQGIDPK
jgi:hypothetical protein